MHHWGDGFPYFKDVGDAAHEIGAFCRRWGRIQVTQTKEKYGTARVYCDFGCSDLHSFFYPGDVYIRWPHWLFRLLGQGAAFAVMTFPLFRPLSSLTYKWQSRVYRLAYKRALRKYPHIRKEILAGADYTELL